MIKLDLDTQPMSQIVAARRALEAEAAERRDLEQKRARGVELKRAYQAATANRLSGDWTIVPSSTRTELRGQLRNLRARSRDLVRNDPYMKKFISMVKSNVVGPHGIKLQARMKDAQGDLDSATVKGVEEAWREWCHAENCSTSGKLSWTDALKMAIATVARDGEMMCRLINADNPFGFALQFIDVNWLDETYNGYYSATGNRVIMSVEVDKNEKPVAYFLTPPADDYSFPGGLYDSAPRARTRVPAEEIIHLFVADDFNQTRGVPWAHAVMLSTKILNGYREAELVAARVGACKGGFLTPPEGVEYAGESDEQHGAIIEDVEPGMVQELPPGYTFHEYNPTHPNQNYEGFVKEILRSLAAGLDLSYFSLATDLKEVNFSSARIGLLEERDVWRGLQQFVIEHFCRRVFRAWLRSAMLTGAVEVKPKDFKRFSEPLWKPRGWTWVDPLKDVQAAVMAINNGLDSRTDTLDEQGGDFAETLDKLAAEQEMIEEKGVILLTGTPVSGTDKPAPEDSGV
jgi:lambda family phage portal protein